MAAWVMLSVQSTGNQGVRMMLRFRRDSTAASLGDIEDYLRNFGVRHSIVRMDEDSEGAAPAAVLLDVEFDPKDFSYGPISMWTRRLRGSVVNGALKTAFQRWKNRGVTVLAAVPFETNQLPRHKPRRWWSEAVSAWFGEFAETMFIRLSRVLLVFVIPAALIVFLLIRLMSGT